MLSEVAIDIKQVYWSESGELVTLACEETFYVLRFSRENYIEALQAGLADEDGVEAAFEIVTDINESVRTGQWVGDCFLFTNTTNRLNYLVGDQTYTISHFDQPMYLLGFLARDGKAFVADKDVNVISYALSLSVIEYQTLVLRGDMDTAAELLVDIADDQKNKIARFLEGQGLKEIALEVATDPEHRFDLALALNNLPIALAIARDADVEHRWKTVGDTALSSWDLALAEECFRNAKDMGSLLLLHTATSNTEGLKTLADQASSAGSHNVAFSCLWNIGNLDGCIDLLVRTNRISEAVLFAQTYKPSRCKEIVGLWRGGLERGGKGKVSRILGVPPADGEGDEDLFPEWDEYLRLEKRGKTEALVDVSEEVNGAEEINGKGVATENGVSEAEVTA